MFLIIPILLSALTYGIWDSEHDLVDCQTRIDCKVDDLPEHTIDKFDVKIFDGPNGHAMESL